MNLHDAKPEKKVVYVISEETRYGTDIEYIGVPDGIVMEEYSFYFDTHNGGLELDQIEADIEDLKALQVETGNVHEMFDRMIAEREQWIADEKANEAAQEAAAGRTHEERLRAARALLREAGELE